MELFEAFGTYFAEVALPIAIGMVDHFQIEAEVAHLVEHDLAKVGVAGSSPVFRSVIHQLITGGFFLHLKVPEVPKV